MLPLLQDELLYVHVVQRPALCRRVVRRRCWWLCSSPIPAFERFKSLVSTTDLIQSSCADPPPFCLRACAARGACARLHRSIDACNDSGYPLFAWAASATLQAACSHCRCCCVVEWPLRLKHKPAGTGRHCLCEALQLAEFDMCLNANGNLLPALDLPQAGAGAMFMLCNYCSSRIATWLGAL